MRILLIEDSNHLRKPVIKGLRASGYAVDEASDGDEVLAGYITMMIQF